VTRNAKYSLRFPPKKIPPNSDSELTIMRFQALIPLIAVATATVTTTTEAPTTTAVAREAEVAASASAEETQVQQIQYFFDEMRSVMSALEQSAINSVHGEPLGNFVDAVHGESLTGGFTGFMKPFPGVIGF
jgi:hypothetical protein